MSTTAVKALMRFRTSAAEVPRLTLIGVMVTVASLTVGWLSPWLGSVSARPALVWSAPRTIDALASLDDDLDLTSVSCPSVSLCVGVDGVRVLSTEHPTAGRASWQLADALGNLYLVSCPTSTECIAAGDSLMWSDDPTGPATSWHDLGVSAGQGHGQSPSFAAIACPTASFCVAVTSAGEVLSSTDPTSGSAWRRSRVDGRVALAAVSCPSSALCVAVDARGRELTSTDPEDPQAVWRPAQLTKDALLAVACPTAEECLATDDSGHVVSTTQLSAQNPAWHTVGLSVSRHGDGQLLDTINCASATLCVIGGSQATYVASDPAGPAGAWTPQSSVSVDDALDCLSEGLCLGSGRNGVAWTSPVRPGSRWSAADVDRIAGVQAVACATPTLCFVGDLGGHLLESTDPIDGRWRLTGFRLRGLGGGAAIFTIACPNRRLCLVLGANADGVDGPGGSGLIFAFDPAHPAVVHEISIRVPQAGRGDPFNGLSCALATLCEADAQNGDVFFSRHPADASSWLKPISDPPPFGASCISATECITAPEDSGAITTSKVGPHGFAVRRRVRFHTIGGINSVACVKGPLCAAVSTHAGVLLTATAPGGPYGAWTQTVTGDLDLTAVTCASTRLCIAVDSDGRALFATPASTGAA